MSDAAPANQSALPPARRAARHPGEHHISTTERGSFCTARCSCGWSGPARRARSLAREDGAGHLAATDDR
ncbi:hypothetical protein ACFWAT_12755 [Streptomyces syringium]|uniref:hypothetical protein n=1 Tax=Streptomyces syringium TaxID=76729 RepID=UPI003659C78C